MYGNCISLTKSWRCELGCQLPLAIVKMECYGIIILLNAKPSFSAWEHMKNESH